MDSRSPGQVDIEPTEMPLMRLLQRCLQILSDELHQIFKTQNGQLISKVNEEKACHKELAPVRA